MRALLPSESYRQHQVEQKARGEGEEMNGWQRIGVTAWAIWSIYIFLVHVTNMQNAEKKAWANYEETYSRCLDLKTEDNERRNQCNQSADQILHFELKEARQIYFIPTFLDITIYPVFIWMLISIAIATVRWIKKGFAPDRERL